MASAQPLTDHDQIRRWAEERQAQPACVKQTGTEGDPGMIRLDFPGFSGEDTLEPISWEQWFKAFDDNNLALLVQDRTSTGQPSNFNKLVSRSGDSGRRESSRAPGGNGRARKSGGSSRTSASKTRAAAKSAGRSAGASVARRKSKPSGRAKSAGAGRGREMARGSKPRTPKSSRRR
ncbi:MAG: hypothetical protein ABI051_14310 [Vicinamibacterales bacterium]